MPKRIMASVRQKDPKVANIVASWPGDDRISDTVQQRKGVELRERRRHIEAVLRGALNRGAVHERARSFTVAIDAVGACAQHGNVFARDLLRAIKREVLIATADARIRTHLNSDFAAGDETGARYAAPQLAQPPQQMIGSTLVIPVVATIVPFNGKAAQHGALNPGIGGGRI